jgi:cysteine-rich repeat protein
MDADANRIDDLIDRDLTSRIDAVIPVEAVFSRPMPDDAVSTFVAAGGVVRHVYHSISYGFTGRIARSAVTTLAPKLGPDLLLLKAERPIERHLDQATRTARVRPVWVNGFAGTTGLNGSSTINIAIVDDGVDPSHPDLAGRMIGWKDYTGDNVTEARDIQGHGTHVAGIALGSGAAFGVGPGTLKWTESGNDNSVQNNDFTSNPIHLPETSFSLTSTATFMGGSATILSILDAPDGDTVFTNQKSTPSGVTPLTLSFDGVEAPGMRYTVVLRQNSLRNVNHYAIANAVTNYPAVGDGFNALRGVAPLSGYYAAKVFPDQDGATTAEIGVAMDDIVSLRESLNIKVVNCSFGLTSGGIDTIQRAKVSSLVEHGLVVVASAGNSGGGAAGTGDPGRAAEVITVGASNDANQLTEYSSGCPKTDPDTDQKPDLIAPGGSVYRTKILSVDANTDDAEYQSFADVQPDDYTSNLGTSMAAPIVSGSAALVIQALEQSGYTWDFQSNASALLVKQLLLATATETNQNRENSAYNPTLGRGDAPRDVNEGYGIVNTDAAIEAALLTWDLKTPLTGKTVDGPYDRRAWARRIRVPAGLTLKLAVTSPLTGDFEVYLYQKDATSNGLPILAAWGEVATATFADAADLYVVVKKIAGSGAFTLTGSTFTCGNGTLEPGEECDDGNTTSGDCCSATCQFEKTIACGHDGGIEPQSADGGTDGGADIDAGDAGLIAPPVDEPPPDNTAAPTVTAPPPSVPGASTAPPHVDRLEAGGGGCSTSGSSGMPLGLVCSYLLIIVIRRRHRA